MRALPPTRFPARVMAEGFRALVAPLPR